MDKDRYYRGVGARVNGFDYFVLYNGVYLGHVEAGGLGYYLRVEKDGEIMWTKFVERSDSYKEDRAMAILRHFLFHVEDNFDGFMEYLRKRNISDVGKEDKNEIRNRG